MNLRFFGENHKNLLTFTMFLHLSVRKKIPPIERNSLSRRYDFFFKFLIISVLPYPDARSHPHTAV